MEHITFKNDLYEQINGRKWEAAMDVKVPADKSYLMSLPVEKIVGMSKSYFKEKQKLILQFAKKKDGEPIETAGGGYQLADPIAFQEELEKLQDVDNKLGAQKIVIKMESIMELNPNGVAPAAMGILLTFLDVRMPDEPQEEDKGKSKK